MAGAAAARQTGVLLINLGTPSAPTPAGVRRFLRQFLSDRRVVDLPRVLWLPILHAFVLPLRPRRVAKAYAHIWTPEGSPLLAIGRAQRAALEAELARQGLNLPVALGMRYGKPSIADALDDLDRHGVERIIVLPLYPQYAASTTASAFDALFSALASRWHVPALHTINDYHDEPAYIDALAQSVRTHWAQSGRARHLLMSFHGLPQRHIERGDPYERQCRATAAALAEALQLQREEWSLSYQSRFGAAAWLQPYTDRTLIELAHGGIRELDLIAPGFPADCLETLEELALRNRQVFLDAGGEDLRYIPALNTRPEHIAALASLCRRALSGTEA